MSSNLSSTQEDVLKGFLGEVAAKKLKDISIYFHKEAALLMQQSAASAQRAEFAKQMWLQMDGVSTAVMQELNRIEPAKLEGQILARVNAMKTELGKAESFAKVAQQTGSIGKSFAAPSEAWRQPMGWKNEAIQFI